MSNVAPYARQQRILYQAFKYAGPIAAVALAGCTTLSAYLIPSTRGSGTSSAVGAGLSPSPLPSPVSNAGGGSGTTPTVGASSSVSPSSSLTATGSSVGGIITVAGVPRAGALIELSGNGQASQQTVSASDGSYNFSGLIPGTYSLVVKVTGAVERTVTVTIE